MLTDQEREIAARRAEQYPPGYGAAYFCRTQEELEIDCDDDFYDGDGEDDFIVESRRAAGLLMRGVAPGCGCPATAVALARGLGRVDSVVDGEAILEESLEDIAAACDFKSRKEFVAVLDCRPAEIACRLRNHPSEET